MKRTEDGRRRYRTFEDLEVYQDAREFRKARYRVARQLPDTEQFELAPENRGAAISLTNNIAECDGPHHFLDQIKFLLHSRGSLEESLDDLNIRAEESYLPIEKMAELKARRWRTDEVTKGCMRFLRARVAGVSSREQELPDSDLSEGDLAELLSDLFNRSTL